MENYWTQYPAFCPLQRNKCWPYFLPGLSGAVWLNKSSPAALSCSLSINIFISLFNYLKHFLCSIYFTQMEVGWAAPSLSKTWAAGAWRNVGHKVLLGSSSSTTFTLARNTLSLAPHTSCLKGTPVNCCHHCSGPCEVRGAPSRLRRPALCRRGADALRAALLSSSAGPCRQAAHHASDVRLPLRERLFSSPFAYQLLRG